MFADGRHFLAPHAPFGGNVPEGWVTELLKELGHDGDCTDREPFGGKFAHWDKPGPFDFAAKGMDCPVDSGSAPFTGPPPFGPPEVTDAAFVDHDRAEHPADDDRPDDDRSEEDSPEEDSPDDEAPAAGGVFEVLFGWVRDLLASIFGGKGGGDDIVEAPEPEAEPGPALPAEDPPDMSQDIIFMEYVPPGSTPLPDEDDEVETDLADLI